VSPGFYKFEGTCEYSTRLAYCIRIDGDMFILGNSAMTGPYKLVLNKAVVNGTELLVQQAGAEAPTLAPAPAIAPVSVKPAAMTTAVPNNAEQRLKQARDLLDKRLINEQQYNEFVARIMKEM